MKRVGDLPMSGAERSRRYRERHPEKVKVAWREQSKRRSETGYHREYRRANLERERARALAYQKAHPEQYARRSAERRARLAEAPGSHTEAEWQELLEAYDGRCAYCGDEATQKDHVHPIARDGSDDIGNIAPACGPCNMSKGVLTLDEWRGRDD